MVLIEYFFFLASISKRNTFTFSVHVDQIGLVKFITFRLEDFNLEDSVKRSKRELLQICSQINSNSLQTIQRVL